MYLSGSFFKGWHLNGALLFIKFLDKFVFYPKLKLIYELIQDRLCGTLLNKNNVTVVMWQVHIKSRSKNIEGIFSPWQVMNPVLGSYTPVSVPHTLSNPPTLYKPCPNLGHTFEH